MQPSKKRDLKAQDKNLLTKLDNQDSGEGLEWATYAGVALRHESYKPRTLKSPCEEGDQINSCGVDGSTAIGNGARVGAPIAND